MVAGRPGRRRNANDAKKHGSWTRTSDAQITTAGRIGRPARTRLAQESMDEAACIRRHLYITLDMVVVGIYVSLDTAWALTIHIERGALQLGRMRACQFIPLVSRTLLNPV